MWQAKIFCFFWPFIFNDLQTKLTSFPLPLIDIFLGEICDIDLSGVRAATEVDNCRKTGFGTLAR